MSSLIRLLANIFAFCLAIFFSLWPNFLKIWFARGLAVLWFDILKFRRWTLLKNVSQVFPDKSFDDRRQLARDSLMHLGLNFIEFCLLPQLNRRWVQNKLIVHGWQNYEKAKAMNKGILLMSLHMGSGDVGIAALSLLGIKTNVISKKFKNQFANQLWFGIREKMGTHFLAPHGKNLAFDILKACRQKEATVFVIDQFMGPPYGVATTFFRKKTGTAYGLSLFSSKTGAPVLPVYVYRDAELKTHLVFDEIVPIVEDADKDQMLQKTTQRYNDALEKIILKHPEQWMWLHRRWKTFS